MKKTLPATKARKVFFRLIATAQHPGHAVTITVDGEPKVVMMSSEEFEGWMETLEIMSDKKLMEGIKQAEQDIKKGRVFSAEEVKKHLKIK